MTLTAEGLQFWTGERMTQLATLWTEGNPTAEIARRMGISKNAVIGKAHRLQLKPRGNPVKFDPRREPRPKVLPATCSWPLGIPGQPGFRFCAKRLPADSRRPYCDEHAAKATVRQQPAQTRA